MFPVSMITGEPLWNSLPVAKIINYPLEPADYKPYAQARICVSANNLYIQLLAFEVKPEEKSTVAAALSFYPDDDGGKRWFWFSADRSGELSCKFIDEGSASEADISKNIALRIYSGEDEQGIYWCSCFTMPLYVAEKFYGKQFLEPGNRMKGNFYKLCDGERKHYGSWFPTDFASEKPFESDSFGELELVRY